MKLEKVGDEALLLLDGEDIRRLRQSAQEVHDFLRFVQVRPEWRTARERMLELLLTLLQEGGVIFCFPPQSNTVQLDDMGDALVSLMPDPMLEELQRLIAPWTLI